MSVKVCDDLNCFTLSTLGSEPSFDGLMDCRTLSLTNLPDFSSELNLLGLDIT